ncbi:transmembrane amino acid transporter protein-domain-containing protein [Mucor mucedo]|uniref:transmembrane amino acid transporter protein-domain-containing protein n=1 Tax=Mucor mucedo TaxID=29922 RepID=UPI00221E5274|nr:transmembrane amino acid transporter protein-domain-containing protein [Mucor mucedo]KAI7893089.1 transmembrane amino acid transporter protein-domain-containing protein [Mucor mucedo]
MGASVNLVNAMMGTGIIGLPLALHLCGFWLGLFFSVTIAYISCMTMHITILCGLKTQTCSLVSLCQTLIGRTGSQIVNFIIFFHTAGTAVSYYILLGDTLPSLLALVFPNTPFFTSRSKVILAFGLLCTLPLSLSRSTAQFAKWSAMSVFLLMLMLIGVLVRVPYYLSIVDKIELELVPVSEGMFKGLAIMSLAFGCSQNLFGVYSSTRDQRPSRWLLTCSIAIGIAFVINIVFAVMAYLCFGKHVHANILLNFPENDPGIQLVKLALGLFMVLTIPLCIHPCRESVMMMFGININNPTNKQHYTVTIGVFALILSIGATLTSLGKVFDVIGGFSTTILGFLLPGCAYLYLFSSDLMFTKGEGSWKLLVISVISILIALPVMYFSVKDAFFV